MKEDKVTVKQEAGKDGKCDKYGLASVSRKSGTQCSLIKEIMAQRGAVPLRTRSFPGMGESADVRTPGWS